jgi:Holliday junction resolvase RusA-like endonuclease
VLEVEAVKLVIDGPPRTKKTSQRIVQVKGRPIIMSSKVAKGWEAEAVRQLARGADGFPKWKFSATVKGQIVWKTAVFVVPVSVRALIYRDAERGDLVGYLQAIGDALERAGVVANDKLIGSWDGSRRLIDRKQPRVEIEIEAMQVGLLPAAKGAA